jgi:hypothetical protein
MADQPQGHSMIEAVIAAYLLGACFSHLQNGLTWRLVIAPISQVLF